MAKNKTNYICQNCGNVSPKWLGRCTECMEWNSYVEEVTEKLNTGKDTLLKYQPRSSPVNISDIKEVETIRYRTGISELDQVLGGGIVRGAVVLIGGEPGIGKSTVMLQVAGILTKKDCNLLYISGEESPSQIKLRADRLSIKSNKLSILSTTSFEDLLYTVSENRYDYIVVDSIQTISSRELTSTGGTVGQVKYVTYRLVELAKNEGITIFIVGQVTKDGAIAGPKVLEHLVDTVLYFEGDYSRGVRILRSVKNRFGSTDEVGIFEMSSKGLLEAGNNVFISTDCETAAGKILCPVLEGSRPFLIEVQALVAPTFFQYPKRNSTGFDTNRLNMLIAILEKKGGINLSNTDVYLNIAGGLRVNEPASDLAVCAALLSSYKDKAITFEHVFVGEVGLTGEVRGVPNMLGRINESIKFGIKSIVAPIKNEKNSKVNLINIRDIKGLLDYIHSL